MNTTGHHRACPVCDSSRAHSWMDKGEMRLLRCDLCGMIYLQTMAAEMATGSFYREAAAYYLSEEKLRSDYAAVRFARELRFFRKHCPRGAVLDVGCSNGAFLYNLHASAPGKYSVLGTDVSTPALEYAKSKGVPVVAADFLAHDFNKQFDAVTFWAVLEHLENPKAFIKKAASVLKEDGLCFVLVPNMNSLAVRLVGSKYRYILPEHVNYFTRRTLTSLVKDHFDIIETGFCHFNPIVILKDMRGHGALVDQKQRGDLLQKTTTYKSNPLFAPLRVGYWTMEKSLSLFGLNDNLIMALRRSTRREVT